MGSVWKRVAFPLVLTLIFGIPGSRSTTNPSRSDDLCTSAVLSNGAYCLYATNLDYIKDRSDGLIFVNRRNVKKIFHERDSLSSHLSWTSKYGSVTCNLHAYSFSEHYSHALANGRKWGLNMTPAELAEALKFYDSFPCED